jgi:hypothetical protein
LEAKRSAIASAPESDVAVPITVPPISPSWSAIAAPRPLDAPVTRQTNPSILIMLSQAQNKTLDYIRNGVFTTKLANRTKKGLAV